jgi:chromosome segregation protein
MYLSKLEIFGFKSFAQKVNIAFDTGVTAIVGPNGCGKTNVVDAIRWVLGEQRPTTLRSDKMEDVIFNGTKSRKPLNVAEVSITVENTKGILPTEYAEVTITRRVFRSGESEYYLNKNLCRLKDIRDLFMDTGMGSDAYSVIELKMVESILSDNSEERRRLFEESAGVTKYKHRRKEACRRLEDVRHDLTRVNDILRGVEKAVNSLERQAQKAEKFNDLTKELHAVEKELLNREYSSISSRIEPLKKELNVAVDEKNRIEVEVRQEEALLDVLRQETGDLEKRISQTQEELNERRNALHELEQKKATALERCRSLAVNIERFEKEKIDLQGQTDELEKRQTDLTKSLEEFRVRTAEAEEVYRNKKVQLDEFEGELNTKRGELKSSQDQVLTLLHELTELRNRENQVKAHRENLRGRIGYINEEDESCVKDVRKNEELIAKLTSENRQLRLAFAEAEVRTHQMEDYKKKLQDEIEDLRRQVHAVLGNIERKQARIDFLKGLVESFDGYSEGAKYLITSGEWGSRIQNTVGEAVTAESAYRVAIETALGEASGYIVVKSVEEAYSAMDFLKKNNKGKATFICLNRIPENENNRRTFNHPGIIDWADNVVTYEQSLERLFKFLLEETLLVKDVAAALAIVNDDPGVRCVTLDGEIVTGNGVVRGGSVRQDEGGHISKRSQLDELTVTVKHLHDEHARIENTLKKKIEELENVDLKKLTDEARTIEQQKTTVEIQMAQIEFEKKRAQEKIEHNGADSLRLTKEVESLTVELQSLSPSIADLVSRQSASEQQVGAFTSEVETMEALWNEYSRMANDANLAVVNLKNDMRSTLQEIEHADTTLQSIAATSEQRTSDIELAKGDITSSTTQIQEIDSALSELRRDYEGILGRKESVDHEYSAKRASMHEIELKLKDERLRQEGSLKAAYDLEMKIQELSMKTENLRSRAQEDFNLTLEVHQYDPQDGYDFNAEREHQRDLKNKVEALGAVNFAAFDEYKSEKERLDFMSAQRDDLEQSEKTLLGTIDEINTTAQAQFLGIFNQIRDNFITTFKSLFDEGDECDLRLEENADPLEARIEIVAKPRGKRPTSIDLLSGGEKTLTAIALLFAIYLVKPSPFCILDEVDAPLDDTNIDRFTRIIKKFSNNTQFVTITHNKRTMEAANAMYGVTMEEEGISKLVSVRFNETARKN